MGRESKRKETVDIDIFITSGNGEKKKYGAIYQNNEQTSQENKEVKPVELAQMKIYQSNTYRKIYPKVYKFQFFIKCVFCYRSFYY